MNKENNEYGEALSQLIISAMKMPPAIRAQLIQALLDRGSDLPQADNVRQELFLHVKEQFDVLLLDTDIDEIIHIVNPYMFSIRARLFAAEQEINGLDVREKHYLDVLELQKAELEKFREKNERLKNSFDEVFNQRNSIQSKNERLEDENEQFRKLYMDALDHRAKLTEALKAIIAKSEDRLSSFANEIGDIAKEALKGLGQ